MIVVQIAGHLGRDPESRFTSSGQKVTSFSVATNTKKGGQDITTWYRITLWGERFDKMLSYLKKGSAVFVTGTLQPPEIYTRQDGTQAISLDITGEMISFSPFGRPNQEGEGNFGQRQQPAAAAAPASSEGSGGDPFTVTGTATGSDTASSEEDLPF